MSAKHMPMESLTGTTRHCADFTPTVSVGTSQSSEDVTDTTQLCASSTSAELQRSKVIEMCQTDRSIFRYGQRCEKCGEARWADPMNFSCIDQVHQLCHSTILELVKKKLKSTNWSEASWEDKRGKMEEFHIWLYIFEMVDLPEEVSANRKAHRDRVKQRRRRKALKASAVKRIDTRREGRDSSSVNTSVNETSVPDVSLASNHTPTSRLNQLKILVRWLREQDAGCLQECYSSKDTYICTSCLGKTWNPPGQCLDFDHQLHHDAAALVVKENLVTTGAWKQAPKRISAYQIVHWFHGIASPESIHYNLQMSYNAKQRSLRPPRSMAGNGTEK